MKKKVFILGTIVAALTLGAATFAITQNINKKASPVDAEEYNAKTSVQNGFFVKVTDVNSIQNGEDLLLVGEGTHTFQHLVGASYHYWMTTEYGGVTASFENSAVYCNNAKGELVTLERDGNTNNFYLKLKHYVDNAHDGYGKIKSGYIVQQAYNNAGVTAFGDLYIRNKKTDVSKEAATWNLQYSQASGNMTIRSNLNNRPLFWKAGSSYNWSSFACSTNTSLPSNVNLYRRVTDTNDIQIEVTNHSDDVYDFGDDTNLNGLEISVRFNEEIVITQRYSDHPEYFKALKVCYAPNAGCFEWCGIPGSFNATVNHNTKDVHLYAKSDTEIIDLRGTYVLGFQYLDETYLLDLSKLGTNAGQVTHLADNSMPITDTYIDPDDAANDHKYTNVTTNVVTIVKEQVDIGVEKFFIKVDENNYLGPGEMGHVTGGAREADYPIRVDSDNHIIYHTNDIDLKLVFDRRTSAGEYDDMPEHIQKIVLVPADSLQPYHIPVELYKLQFTPNLRLAETLDAFRAVFFANTTAFDRTGVTRKLRYSSWVIIKDAFEALPLDLKSYLASLSYTHNHEEEKSVEDMIDIYDMIYSTYYNVEDGFDDFIGRNDVGTLVHDRNVTLNGSHCTVTGDPLCCYNSSYTATIEVNDHHELPEFVEVLMGNVPLEEGEGKQYTYNKNSSPTTIVIGAEVIVDDITINVEAKFTGFTVTYDSGEGKGFNYVVERLDENEEINLVDFATTGFTAPKWKRFKCWSIGGVEYDPLDSYEVTDDVIITAIYEYESAAVEEVENIHTIASLSYQYEKDNSDNFTFSNVNVRFSGFMSKADWDALNDVSPIQGYGIMFTDDYLEGAPLNENNCLHDMYVSTKPHPNSASPALKEANGVPVENEYYAWNLKINVADGYYETTFTAVAYIKTTNGYVYFNQLAASVKSLAQELLGGPNYDDESLDGSIHYLAHLGE